MAADRQVAVLMKSTDVTLLLGLLGHQHETYQKVRNEVMVGMIDRVDKALRDGFEFQLDGRTEATLKEMATRWLDTHVPGAVQLMPVEFINDLTVVLWMVWRFAFQRVSILAENSIKGWEGMANVSSAEREKNKIRADTLRRFVEVFLPFT
jgi:hypothetical protein